MEPKNLENRVCRYTIYPCGFTFPQNSPVRSGTCYIIAIERMPAPLFGWCYIIRDIDSGRIFKVADLELKLENDDF